MLKGDMLTVDPQHSDCVVCFIVCVSTEVLFGIVVCLSLVISGMDRLQKIKVVHFWFKYNNLVDLCCSTSVVGSSLNETLTTNTSTSAEGFDSSEKIPSN